MLLSTAARPRPRTFWWNARTDRVRPVVRRAAIAADLSARRLLLTDPRGGPCNQSVVRLGRPGSVLARLPHSTVTGWNATGDAMLLTDCYFDEPYGRRVVVRRDPDQRVLGVMSTNTRRYDKFGPAVWETRTTWLHLRFDDDRAYVERCNKRMSRCERATRRWATDVDPLDGALRSPAVVLGTR